MMNIPLIQHRATGVHITDQVIWWVELSRIHHRISVERFETQQVQSGDIRTALTELTDRISPSFPFVTANLNPDHLDISFTDVPVLDDEEYLNRWIEEAYAEQLPPGVNHGEYLLTHHFLGDPEEGQQCMFAGVAAEHVEQRIDMMESAGIKPVILSTGIPEAGYAVMFDEEFNSGTSWLLNVFEDQASLQHYRDGLLIQLQLLNSKNIAAGELMAEAETLLASHAAFGDNRRQYYLLAGKGLDLQNPESNSEAGAKFPAFETIHPLSHLSLNKQKLPPDSAVACGMAIKQLYPDLDNLNLLEEQHQQTVQKEIEKNEAVHTASLWGGSVCGLLLLLFLVQWLLGSQARNVEAQRDLMEDKITAVTEARDRLKQLQRNVSEGRRLITERTSAAHLLETVGSALPEGLWLSELDMNINTGSTDAEVSLKGFAWNDALIARLLEQFEQNVSAENVRLIYSGQVYSTEIYDNPQFRQRQLVHFEAGMIIDQQKMLYE